MRWLPKCLNIIGYHIDMRDYVSEHTSKDDSTSLYRFFCPNCKKWVTIFEVVRQSEHISKFGDK